MLICLISNKKVEKRMLFFKVPYQYTQIVRYTLYFPFQHCRIYKVLKKNKILDLGLKNFRKIYSFNHRGLIVYLTVFWNQKACSITEAQMRNKDEFSKFIHAKFQVKGIFQCHRQYYFLALNTLLIRHENICVNKIKVIM